MQGHTWPAEQQNALYGQWFDRLYETTVNKWLHNTWHQTASMCGNMYYSWLDKAHYKKWWLCVKIENDSKCVQGCLFKTGNIHLLIFLKNMYILFSLMVIMSELM